MCLAQTHSNMPEVASMTTCAALDNLCDAASNLAIGAGGVAPMATDPISQESSSSSSSDTPELTKDCGALVKMAPRKGMDRAIVCRDRWGLILKLRESIRYLPFVLIRWIFSFLLDLDPEVEDNWNRSFPPAHLWVMPVMRWENVSVRQLVNLHLTEEKVFLRGIAQLGGLLNAWDTVVATFVTCYGEWGQQKI